MKKKSPKINILEQDEEIHKLVKTVVGDEGFHIINHLFAVEKADEFEIADSLEEDVNFVRSVMYKMYTNNLVSYTRRRDPERGWYIYTWELIPQKLYHALINSKQKKLDKLFKQVEEEKNKEQVFHCPTCMINLEFPKALELSFSCFACGGMLQPLNNVDLIKNLDHEIKGLSEKICILKTKLNEL
ncbi:MAG: transcription initiation factor E subunit alpha [Nanoarchaeota archaeon]|nr:transcription initiation factor E subunit alpha [Nanoarchaeota archaeon]